MTTLIRLMEGAGLVTRRPDPDDRRAALVALTASAREFAPVAGEVVAELERRVGERLSADELRALRRGLQVVTDL